jgi:hypothetical protein
MLTRETISTSTKSISFHGCTSSIIYVDNLTDGLLYFVMVDIHLSKICLADLRQSYLGHKVTLQ